MKGFQYVNKSTSLINCPKLEDEICNGGPKVWKKLTSEFSKCMNPCKRTTYKDSRLDWYEPMYMKEQLQGSIIKEDSDQAKKGFVDRKHEVNIKSWRVEKI